MLVRKIISIRKNLKEGRPSQWAFSKQVGKFQFDCNLYLGLAESGLRDGRPGLHKRVSEIVFSKLNERKPEDKEYLVKKSEGSPFILKVSRMNGRVGKPLPNFSEIMRIL